jgi:hypothetical protein
MRKMRSMDNIARTAMVRSACASARFRKPWRWPMTGSQHKCHGLRAFLLGLGAVAALGMTGCQIDVGGQTIPSPYYIYDDVQYFPPGPEFKLSREAAAQKAYVAEQQAVRR